MTGSVTREAPRFESGVHRAHYFLVFAESEEKKIERDNGEKMGQIGILLINLQLEFG